MIEIIFWSAAGGCVHVRVFRHWLLCAVGRGLGLR